MRRTYRSVGLRSRSLGESGVVTGYIPPKSDLTSRIAGFQESLEITFSFVHEQISKEIVTKRGHYTVTQWLQESCKLRCSAYNQDIFGRVIPRFPPLAMRWSTLLRPADELHYGATVLNVSLPNLGKKRLEGKLYHVGYSVPDVPGVL